MNRLLKFFTYTLVLTGLMAPHASAIEYRMRDLGTLGGSYGEAAGINEKGQVVGFARLDGNLITHGFLWQNGQMTDLGTLVAGDNSLASAINNDGQIVGTSMVHPSSITKDRGFLWQNGSMQDLGTLGGLWSRPWYIGDNGLILGQSSTVSGKYHACMWQNGVLTDLGTMEGFVNSTAGGMCNGKIVGGAANSSGSVTEAIMWDNGSIVDLGKLPGFTGSFASDINASGIVVGGSYKRLDPFTSQTEATCWQNGVMTDLGEGGVGDINDVGQMVGVSNGHAVMWQNGIKTTLDTTAGVSSSNALAINNSGWVVGYTVDMSGNHRPVLWEPVPEPSSILALAGGLAGLLGIRRRRA